jgi:hypothetical protein
MLLRLASNAETHFTNKKHCSIIPMLAYASKRHAFIMKK